MSYHTAIIVHLGKVLHTPVTGRPGTSAQWSSSPVRSRLRQAQLSTSWSNRLFLFDAQKPLLFYMGNVTRQQT
jgi:hypothetical protein